VSRAIEPPLANAHPYPGGYNRGHLRMRPEAPHVVGHGDGLDGKPAMRE